MGLNPQLREIHHNASTGLALIAASLPPHYKLTLICRHTEIEGAEIVTTSDDLSLALGTLARLIRQEAPKASPPASDTMTAAQMAALGRLRSIELLALWPGDHRVAEVAREGSDFIERCVETLSGPIGAEELAERGLNERMQTVVEILVGETIDDRSPARQHLKLTQGEIEALGYGPPCPCGERGLLRGECLVETPEGELCAECAKAEQEASDV